MSPREDLTEQQPGDRRTRKSQAAIRNALFQLLSEKELSQISVTELTRRADLDRKTFYLHYRSIDDLIDELLREEMVRIAGVLENTAIGSNGHIDIKRLFDLLGVELLTSFNTRAAVIKHVDTDKIITRLTPILTDTICEKDSLMLSNTLGPYLELFVAFFCSGLLSLYHQWITEESELPLENLAKLASSAVAGGIASLSMTAQGMNLGKEQ